MNLRHLRRSCFSLLLLAGLSGWAWAGDPFTISAPAFAQGKPIPPQYARKGQNISPELQIAHVPATAHSLVLICDDPDAPVGLWTHWLVWNLSAETTSIPEEKLPPNARVGTNSFHEARYDGPEPPPGSGIHRYFFRLYALDTTLTLPTGSDRATLLAAMNGHIVGITETFGIYQYGPALPK